MNKLETVLSDFNARFHKRIHSHGFRRMALLALVVTTLSFSLIIINLNREILQEMKDSETQPSAPNPWEKDVRSMVQGSPMEKMIPYIANQDKKTAAFLVSIAKKESGWGKHSPKLNGKDCYNYWGYRDQSRETTWDGYTCFLNPRQAVNVVSRRIKELVYESELDTPQKMAVWKCGHDCSWDNPVAVKKWISDVNYYFQKFYE